MVGSVLSFGSEGAKIGASEHSGTRRGVMNRVTHLVFFAHPYTAFFLDGMGVRSEWGVGSSNRGPCDRREIHCVRVSKYQHA